MLFSVGSCFKFQLLVLSGGFKGGERTPPPHWPLVAAACNVFLSVIIIIYLLHTAKLKEKSTAT